MEISETDMIGRRDIDKQFNWSNHYKSDQYTAKAINFIFRMRESGCIINSQCQQQVNSDNLGEKKRHLTLL